MQKILSLAAAAGLLIAGLTGCSSSDDNGGNNPAATTSATPADAGAKPPASSAAGGNAARAASCDKIEKAALALVAPLVDLGKAGTDRAALDAAVKKVNAALDVYAAELTKVAGETGDAELKAAIGTAGTEVQSIKTAITGAKDAKALQELIDSPTFGARQDELQAMCKS